MINSKEPFNKESKKRNEKQNNKIIKQRCFTKKETFKNNKRN